MIVECPKCKTAHSKGEQELASGAPIVCRRCGASFAAPGRDGEPRGVVTSASAAAPRSPGAPRDLAFDLDIPAPAAPAPPAATTRPAATTPPAATARPAATAPPVASTLPAARPGAPSGPADAAAADHFALDLDVDVGLDVPPPGTAPSGRAATVRPAGTPPAGTAAVMSLELDDTGERSLASGAPSGAAVVSGPASSGAVSSSSAAGAPLTPVSSPIPAPAVPFAADAVPRPPGPAASARGEGRARDDVTRLQPAGARGNVFPREAWARFLADLLSYLRAGSWRVRLAAAAVVLLPLAVLAGLVLAVRPGHPVAYVSETEPLLAGPLGGAAYPRLGAVDRGGRVEVIETAGDYSLVRDSIGRVGFLPGRSLEDDAPDALPSRPFADCARAPLERSTDRCHSRAQEQFDSCRDVCGGPESSACLEHCQRRFSDCLAACESEPRPAESAAPAVPEAARAVGPAAAPSPPPSKAVRREPAASGSAHADGVKRKPRRTGKAKKKPR